MFSLVVCFIQSIIGMYVTIPISQFLPLPSISFKRTRLLVGFPTGGDQQVSSDQPGSTLLSLFFLLSPEQQASLVRVSCFSVRVTFPGRPKSSLDGSYNQWCNESEWVPCRNFRTLWVLGAVGVEVGRVFLLCFLPKIRPRTSTDDCALWAATTQAVKRSRPWSKPCLGSMLLCPSPPPPTHRAQLFWRAPPSAKALGLSDGPASQPREWFLWFSPHSSFSIRVTRQPQKAAAPDANPALPSDKRGVRYWAGLAPGLWVCHRRVAGQVGQDSSSRTLRRARGLGAWARAVRAWRGLGGLR